jgi:hypothetical protein
LSRKGKKFVDDYEPIQALWHEAQLLNTQYVSLYRDIHGTDPDISYCDIFSMEMETQLIPFADHILTQKQREDLHHLNLAVQDLYDSMCEQMKSHGYSVFQFLHLYSDLSKYREKLNQDGNELLAVSQQFYSSYKQHQKLQKQRHAIYGEPYLVPTGEWPRISITQFLVGDECSNFSGAIIDGNDLTSSSTSSRPSSNSNASCLCTDLSRCQSVGEVIASASSRPITSGEPHYVGIENPGNTCYIISIIQMVYRIYPFSDAVMSVSDDLPTLSKQIKSYLKQNPDPSGNDSIVANLGADAVARSSLELKHLFVQLTESASESISIVPFIEALGINYRVNGDNIEFFECFIFFYIRFFGMSQLFCGLRQMDCYADSFSMFPSVQHEGQEYFPFNYLELPGLKE